MPKKNFTQYEKITEFDLHLIVPTEHVRDLLDEMKTLQERAGLTVREPRIPNIKRPEGIDILVFTFGIREVAVSIMNALIWSRPDRINIWLSQEPGEIEISAYIGAPSKAQEEYESRGCFVEKRISNA